MIDKILKPFKWLGKQISIMIIELVNFIKSLEWLKFDKILHFTVGYMLADLLHDKIGIHWTIMVSIVMLISIGKEVYDLYVKKTEFDKWDAFMTISGMIFWLVVV